MSFLKFLRAKIGKSLLYIFLSVLIFASIFGGAVAVGLLFNLPFETAWAMSCLIAIPVMLLILVTWSYSNWKEEQSFNSNKTREGE